jgi:hypothetical protein
MQTHRNTSAELMTYFDINSRDEFTEFWFSLTVEEQLYYRHVELT